MSLSQEIYNLNKDLNPSQREGAEFIDGSLMIVASAGSGKTKTIIHRCATMLMSGISPKNIMVVTFTKQAADEVKKRLEEMPSIGINAQFICAGTFHSIILSEIIKQFPDNSYMKELGYDCYELINFDESDMQGVMKDALNQLSDEDKDTISENGWKVSHFQKEISLAKSYAYDLRDYIAVNVVGSENEEFSRITANVWKNYQHLCIQSNGIDFDDILLYADKLLQEEPSIAQALSAQFKYIMLDEYQDTNRVQQNIMDSIASHHGNICVVGDDKQSIYKFRGADINVILSFKNRYSNVKVINLKDNYRSYSNIIEYANGVAYNMKELVGSAEDGLMNNKRMVEESSDLAIKRKSNTAAIVEFSTPEHEAETISKAIRRDIISGTKPCDVAVLYRNKIHKRELEKSLMLMNINYEVINDKSLYQSAEVKNVIALIRFLFKPFDNRAGLRVMDAMTLGVSSSKAKEVMAQTGVSVHRFLIQKSQERLKIGNKGGDLPYKATALKLQPLLTLIDEIGKCAFYQDSPSYIADVMSDLWEIYMSPGSRKKAERENKDFSSVKENVSMIIKRVRDQLEKGFTPDEIIEELALMVDSSMQTKEHQEMQVKLMTMHASKGLEFPNVYLIGVDENTMLGDPEEAEFGDIQEAMRLLYVAITRAEKKLTVSYSKTVKLYSDRIETIPCRFLNDICEYTNTKIFKMSPPRSMSYNQ